MYGRSRLNSGACSPDQPYLLSTALILLLSEKEREGKPHFPSAGCVPDTTVRG